MSNIKSIPGKPLKELKGPKAVAYYAVLHLPSASYLCRTDDSIPFSINQFKLLLFRSKEKARHGLKVLSRFRKLYTTSEDTISNENRLKWHYFEAVHAFTLIIFPNGDKLLRLYLPSIELKKLLTSSQLNYFKEHPERIKHENCI